MEKLLEMNVDADNIDVFYTILVEWESIVGNEV